MNRALVARMSASEPTSRTLAENWLANQPYLLLCITALCWAGNAIVGRLAAGHIPPVTLSFLRWSFAFLLILPFAWKHLVRDWSAIRSRLGNMIVLSITGIGAFTSLQYWALEHTQALNTLLLQSAGPLIVAVWSLIPLFIWELFTRPAMQIDANNLLTLFYVAVFPSTLAYLCFNRGVQLIGANRAAPFFHVVPVFGSVMAMAFLGERPQIFHLVGFALVLTGVFVASRKPARAK